MRFLISFLLISSLYLPTAGAQETARNSCLDSSRVRNWIVVNDETVLLDTGLKKYRVTLRNTCFNLGTSPTLQFKGDISGRICGSSLDALRVRGETCPIASLEEIDKRAFKEAQNRKKLTLRLRKSAPGGDKMIETEQDRIPDSPRNDWK